ncbi:stage V sporulation protein AB [Paenibacillus phyllosphaerae]|uniref:Stage V sporulation protein AB n=1 Tax=Paenibacillus phyllosphaerae TaxID=274593 RepID=A0A7W5AV28_9BACL|nr:stage V sporulation protein AB [Paenibacillus phyllosphaerae]MBB3109223.1 stage V sporulation protein AB [Paenibacillus phyllosphaerae]
MSHLAANLFVAVLGLAGGLAVGSGLVSLLIVLDLIPRLAQLAGAYRQSLVFETAVLAGAMYWSLTDMLDVKLMLPWKIVLMPIGLLTGIFVGMLAAALTEVMNVLPILAKRLHLHDYMVALVMAMVLGKIIGSLFDWLVFQWMV